MFGSATRVLGVCVLLSLGGLGCTQNPETKQKTGVPGPSAKPAAETAANLDQSSAPTEESLADQADSLRL